MSDRAGALRYLVFILYKWTVIVVLGLDLKNLTLCVLRQMSFNTIHVETYLTTCTIISTILFQEVKLKFCHISF